MKDQSPYLMQARDYVAERLKDRVGAHDFNHILRVYDWCMKIGAELNADLEILGLAALLHDIIRRNRCKSTSVSIYLSETKA